MSNNINVLERLSPIAFGAWAIGGWMWGGSNKKEAIEAIQASINHGVTTIDTAPVYGFGDSEKIIGEAIRPYKNEVQILTKFGLTWDHQRGKHYFDAKTNQGQAISVYKYAGKNSIIQECENSLIRLKTDTIDLYQIHWPDTTTEQEETMEAVDILKHQGKIIAAGVCNYDKPLLEKAISLTQITSNQVPYSMLERSIEKEVIPFCQTHHIGILAYSPLQRGLLTGKMKPNHTFKPGDHRQDTSFFSQKNIQAVNQFLHQISPIAEKHGCSLAQLVLSWTRQQPGVSCVLAGARNAKQAIDNAGSLQIHLNQNERNQINHHLQNIHLKL